MSGRPLISWTISAAKRSCAFDHVVVSTDDEEIAEIAERDGAWVPFVRPDELSDDHAGTLPVIAHAIDELKVRGIDFEATCCIYPAALAVGPREIVSAKLLLADHPAANFVTTVTKYPAPVQEALQMERDGALRYVTPGELRPRTQDYAPRWYDAGQLYWGTNTAWLSADSMLDGCIGYELPTWRVQDIDTEEDWERAEIIHKIILERGE